MSACVAYWERFQGVDGVRDLGVDLGLRVGLALVVGLAVELQRVARVLERGHEGPGEVQVAHRLPDQHGALASAISPSTSELV